MSTIFDIYNFIDGIAPFDTAMDFDNVGILVRCQDKVDKVVVSLDITPSAIEMAKKIGAQLIISHHPVIFKSLRSIDYSNVNYMLIKENISAICAHTNLDMAVKGVNYNLASCLNLKLIKPISFYKGTPCALIGETDREYSQDEFITFVKKVLNCKGVRFVRGKENIKTVALCSGAGGEFLFDAIGVNADAFITGEIKHHEILAAEQHRINLIEAGHFNTENIVIEPLTNMLKREFNDVKFLAYAGNDCVEYM